MSSSSLFSGVEDAASGKTPYKHSENFIVLLARVCYVITSLFVNFVSFTHSQNLNGKLQSIEAYLILHPIRSVFFALAFITGILYVLFRIVGTPSADDWRDVKPRNTRLD